MTLRDGGEREPLLNRQSANSAPKDKQQSSSMDGSPSYSEAAAEEDGGSMHSESQEIRDIMTFQEPVMRKSFSPLSALGLGFSITNSWVGYLSCFGQNLAYAGPHNVVFGLLVATVVQWIITLGLSEIASAFPTSGGQYHFVHILAPKKHQRFAAFVIGWMNLLGWSVALCSGVSVAAASIVGLIAFWSEAFKATQWQLYLFYLVTASLSILPLFLANQWIPKILQASLAFSVTGFVTVFGLVLAMRKQSQPFSFVLWPQAGTSGWATGPAWVMGISNSMYAFTATDAVIHIAEEMNEPGKDIPRAMNMTIAIGFLTSFPLMLVMMLSMTTDMNAIADAPLPYAELFYQITGSRAATTLVMAWVTTILFTALIGQWVTCGRLAWAVARDHGLPYSAYFSHISDRYGFPVRTTLLALCFCMSYGVLYFVSTTAFNSIITSAVLYLVPWFLFCIEMLRG